MSVPLSEGLMFSTPKKADDEGQARARASNVKAASDYATAIAKAIKNGIKKGEYPRLAKERGLSGTVKLRLVLKPDGKVSSLTVAASSGHPVLDDYAIALARRTPYPPFPARLRDSSEFTIQAPVRFDLVEQ